MLEPAGLGAEVPVASASLMLFANFGYDIRGFSPRARELAGSLDASRKAEGFPRILRGIVEAVGHGLRIKHGDLLARGNFATVDRHWHIIDLRAGRIDDTAELVAALNALPFECGHNVVKTKDYRVLVQLRDHAPLSDKISEVDPHEVGRKVMECRPLDRSAARSAHLVNSFLHFSYNILANHHFNRGRKLPANFLLLRGFGASVPKLEPFHRRFGLKAVGITGLDVNKGVCRLLGMDVISIPEEIGGKKEFSVKRKPIKQALKKYDFVFVHFKNTDDPGHDGDAKEKVRQIELTDRFIGSLDLRNKIVVVTADHSTPCDKMAHSADPVPTLVSLGPAKKGSRKFGERYCRDFRMHSHELMRFVLGV
jgi:2,3-bisphosphoglycerate-independent phosphoglycerate mutase